MKSRLKLLLAAGLCAGIALGGCGCGSLFGLQRKCVTGIEKTASEGLVDIYTVYYSDGTTSFFEVKNGQNGADGKNGQNGADLTVREVYEEYVRIYGEISYADFLALYFTMQSDDVSSLHSCLLSTAKVYCEFTENVTEGGVTSEKPVGSTGAAVIWEMNDEDTFLLTNYHVVYNHDAVGEKLSSRIYAYLYGCEGHPSKVTGDDGTITYEYEAFALPCEYVGGAVSYDMALLRVDTEAVLACNPHAKAVTLAQDYAVGETAIAVGNPNDKGMSVTKGIVSVDVETIQLSIDGKTRTYRSMRIDTPLYKGNSGGGVFNAAGEMIGLAHAGDIDQQNINYAVPLGLVKAGVENILHYYRDGNDETLGVFKLSLGVTITAKNPRFVYDGAKGYGKIKEEITVMEIAENSIAQAFGLQAGDILTALVIGGKEYPLSRSFEITNLVLGIKSGESLAVRYVRAGEESLTENYTVKASDIVVVE